MTNEEPLDDETKETDQVLFPNEIGILNIESLLIEKKIKYNNMLQFLEIKISI